MSRGVKFLPGFFVACVLALAAPAAEAQESKGSVLFVAPHRLIVTPDEKVDIINVSNNSDEARRYDLTLIDQVMSEEGVTVRKKSFPYSIRHMVKFVPKRFSLQPGERQTVRVMVTRPDKLPDGDYHSHLLFREVPLSVKDKQQLQAEKADTKTVSFEIRTLYGIAIPIVVQSGKVEADIATGDVSMGKDEDGKPTLNIQFLRTGNSEAAGKVTAAYVPPADSVTLVDGQWIRIYRELEKLNKSFPLKGLPENTTGGKIVLSIVKDEADDSKTVRKEIPL